MRNHSFGEYTGITKHTLHFCDNCMAGQKTMMRARPNITELLLTKHYSIISRGNVFQFTSAKPEYKLAMLVGSSTVSSTASSQMGRCLQTRPWAVETTLSIPSSARPVLVNMYHVLCLLIWNLLLLVRNITIYVPI